MLKIIKTSLLSASIIVTGITTTLTASDILVTVNGKNITKQDAETFVKASSPEASFATLDKTQQAMIKERLVEKVLFTELAKKRRD
jgi:hypothetical protein